MNKKVKFIFIVIVICIVSIIGFLLSRYYLKNQPLNATRLEKMKDSELADLFYKTSKEDEFVNETEKNYRFSYKVADNAEDAIEKTKGIGISNTEEILELKLQSETEYYYVVYQEYISHRGTGDVTFKNSYLYFKSSIINIDNETINTEILSNASKVKELFNLYTYIKESDNASGKLLFPEITEEQNEYIYTYYYLDATYGDWGLSDSIELYKYTISINKQTGKFEVNEKRIRQVTGKTNNQDD
mgnify:FL=1